MLHFAVEERGNLTGKVCENAIKSVSYNVKDLIERHELFNYYDHDEKRNIDIFYLDRDKFFLVLREVRKMLEHERNLYKKLELDLADYFDLEYGDETIMFWKFLCRVALNAKFDWSKYTITIKIETFESVDFDDIEI